MAHKSIIACDQCGLEEKPEGGPYPEGWALVAVSQWTKPVNGPRTKHHRDKDLCPTCFAKVSAVLSVGDSPPAK